MTKVLPIVTIKPSNVRKKIREPSVVTISFLKNYFIKSVNFTHKEKRVYNQFNELEKYQVVCKLQSSKTKTKAKHLIWVKHVFWSFFMFWGILVIFMFQWYFGNFKVLEYFGHFLGFRSILVIFRFWGYFGHFFRFQGYFGQFFSIGESHNVKMEPSNVRKK